MKGATEYGSRNFDQKGLSKSKYGHETCSPASKTQPPRQGFHPATFGSAPGPLDHHGRAYRAFVSQIYQGPNPIPQTNYYK